MEATNEKPQSRQTNPADDTLSIAELLDDERDPDHESVIEKKVQQYKHLKYVRMIALFSLWLTFTVILFVTKETTRGYRAMVVPVGGKIWEIEEPPSYDMITIKLEAPFQQLLSDIVDGKYRGDFVEPFAVESGGILQVQVVHIFKNKDGQKITENVSKILEYGLVESSLFDDLQLIRIERENVLALNSTYLGGEYYLKLGLTEVDRPLPLKICTIPIAVKSRLTVVLSALLFAFLFAFFFWDIVTRGIIAMIFSTLAVALLGIFHNREPLKELPKHVDLDVILLIFGLTLIICIFAETGGDLYLAVQFYRLSNGHIWPMLTVMCLAVAFSAAFLDSTTILILITSLSIRLCEILQLNPTSVLTCLMLFSNTGYMLTKTGLPENSVLSQKGVIEYSNAFKGYGSFLVQMLLPVALSLALTYGYLRFYYASSKRMRTVDPPIVLRLRNAIRFWSRTAQGMPGYTKEETALRQNMLSKVQRLRQRLRRLGKMPLPAEDFQQTLKFLREKYKIHNRWLLVKCCIVLIAVVVMQIAFSFQAHELSPGWICILFALMLLALSNWHDFDALMAKIDWSTLITIACLLIITHALQPLGLMEEIGNSTMKLISMVPQSYRLNTASTLIVIVTTFCSAIMDEEHVSYVMSSKAVALARDPESNIDLDPLLFAVFLGAGFGTNATLVSSISNIVCAGIAEKHGFKFYFYDFFKVGIVVTIGNILIGILYLLTFSAVLGYK